MNQQLDAEPHTSAEQDQLSNDSAGGALELSSAHPARVKAPFGILSDEVCALRIEFAGRDARNVLEVERKHGLGTSRANITRERASYRRRFARDLNRRLTKRMFSFTVRASDCWRDHVGDGTSDFGWSVRLFGENGDLLRERTGCGRIAEPHTFLSFARGLEATSRGFVADTLPLARIQSALELRNPMAYDRELDALAAGAIACALGVDYMHEGLGAESDARRAAALHEARLRFLDAAHFGSARAQACLGRLAMGMMGERDPYRARHSLERATDGGSPEGCYLLADLLREEGEGDETRIRELYERAYLMATYEPEVEVWAPAALRLAECLFEGLGGSVDFDRARDLALDAELGLAGVVSGGMPWMQPELERAMKLSEHLHGAML